MIKIIVCVLVVAAVAVVGFVLLNNTGSSAAEAGDLMESTLSSVKFTVEGEVNYPGTYTLASNAMMSTLIEAAGGVTSNADSRAYYVDAELTGGMTYYIASKYDESDLCSYQEIEKVNVNSDSAALLSTVNGISSSVGEKIVEYRETNGSFMTIEALKEVSGIGDATYTKIRNYVILHA